MALTDVAIRALKPREIRYYVNDGRGLWLEVFPAGGMAWRYRYSLNGKPEKVVVGEYPDMSLKKLVKKGMSLLLSSQKGYPPHSKSSLRKWHSLPRRPCPVWRTLL